MAPASSPPHSAEPGQASSSTMNSHLSYPAPTADLQPPPPTSAQPRQLLQERLYVGNLHPSVDEYTLLQAFSKFGRVSKLDFLFHKVGPHKGRPRGYAFVEYASSEDAQKALIGAHDKLLRGRRLVVTQAHQAPLDYAGAGGHGVAGGTKFRRMGEAGKPTTLSMLKSAAQGRADATDAKIARMEAKLRQMDQAESASTSGVPLHPSLPAKPLSAPPASVSSSSMPQRQSVPTNRRIREPLPSLPLTANSPPATPTLLAPHPRAESAKRPLTGVRIVRNKLR
ncbi:RNA-binding domain-containing protein [Amylocystis lapponica]|nr:RNA-binding domain-containing protein [Amylocystis lapponica]